MNLFSMEARPSEGKFRFRKGRNYREIRKTIRTIIDKKSLEKILVRNIGKKAEKKIKNTNKHYS